MLVAKVLPLLLIIVVLYVAVRIIIGLPEVRVWLYGNEANIKKETAKKVGTIDLESFDEADKQINDFKTKTNRRRL